MKTNNNNIMKKKRLIRLTEGDLHRIIKESVNRVLNEQTICEGEKWIGSFNLDTFDNLRRIVTQKNGKCSFQLNNEDFTIRPTKRGFTITSNTDFGYDALSIESALKAAWEYSNQHLINR